MTIPKLPYRYSVFVIISYQNANVKEFLFFLLKNTKNERKKQSVL